VLICPTPGLKAKDFKSEIKTKYLLGPRYVLLRDEILNCKVCQKQNKDIKQILVSFGASFFDIKIIKKFITVFESLFNGKKIIFLTGITSSFSKQLILKKTPQNSYLFISAQKFSLSEITLPDLVISTASTIFWEFNYLNVRHIIFFISQNQKGNVIWLNTKKNIKTLGNIKRCNTNLIKLVCKEVIKSTQRKNIIIDGKGKNRIYEYIMKIFYKI